MLCSHCGVAGHTYLKCPQLTPKSKEKMPSRKKKKIKSRGKKIRERSVEVYKNLDYTFVNNNMYGKFVYWAFSNIP